MMEINKLKNLFKKEGEQQFFKWLLFIAIVFFILSVIYLLTDYILEKKYDNYFLNKTNISSIDISNLTIEEAKEKIEKQIDFINTKGFAYTGDSKTVIIYPNISSIESVDASYPLIIWDTEKSLNLIKLSQNDYSLLSKIKTLISGKYYPLLYSWDKEQHLDILKNSFQGLLKEKQEAFFTFINNDLEIKKEEIGIAFDYNQAINKTEEQIKELLNKDIELITTEDKPLVTEEIITEMESMIIETASKGNLLLTYNEKQWEVDNQYWRQWLTIKARENNNLYLGVNEELFDLYLINNIKSNIETEVRDAKFKLIDGRVAEFISSRNGVAINIQEILDALEKLLIESAELNLELITNIVYPNITNSDVNDLGIKEVIGIGYSNFSGSPVNRIHNINIGADSLNGVLIKPGEEFSLIQALGEIDGEHGYREELVIKGDETVPEFGGGLCQIGTTVFRGALDSGLEITQRRNHSYRVSYYEPAGTDATIYNPWPDLKFLNNTEQHILLQTRIQGTELYFDFWGTKDGRIASTTYPIIYNIVEPPGKKIIKTLDLEPGEEKCTERAHNGADAKFTYTVKHPNEEEIETIFYSHYIPWQEVCLLGVTEEDMETSTSTDEEIE